MDVALALPLLVGLIAIALFFDFLNGLHDAANSIATIVSTRVLRPQYAVAWAAFFNFIAFLFFGLHVAETLGTGIIDPAIVSPQVIFAALIGAIVWNIVTWIFGIPSSSSHALIGGLVGAGFAKVGFNSIVWSGLLKTVGAIFMSPAIGFFLALVLVLAVSWLFVRQTPFAVDRTFRVMQFISASLYSLGHGGNDAQKTMGIIAVLLFSQGHLGESFYVPFWVVISCQSAMALGTLFGGWRIVHTMGSKITRLNPMQGFCAETGGALTLFGATWLGIPVSTTHTITRRHHRCRRCTPCLGGALGACRQYRHRLDRDHAGSRTDLRCRLRADLAVLIAPMLSRFAAPTGTKATLWLLFRETNADRGHGTAGFLEGLSEAVTGDGLRLADACDDRRQQIPLPHPQSQNRQSRRKPLCRQCHPQAGRRQEPGEGFSARRG
ncbi:phosphate/sulfate permease [Agrobacterium tumefaciens]|nr:phosphate/sulfate permease [Agrobacterium tumefaciens]